MGAIINRMAYAWLVTTEVFEELFFSVGDFFRRMACEIGSGKKTSRFESRTYSHLASTAKVTDTI